MAHVGAIEVIAKKNQSRLAKLAIVGVRSADLQIPLLMLMELIKERTGLLKLAFEPRIKGAAGKPTVSC